MAKGLKKKKRSKLGEKIDAALTSAGKLSKIQRLVICLLTFILIGGGYYYFIYMPKSEELSQAKKELKNQSEQLRLFKIKASSLAKWEAKMKNVQGQFNLAMEALPDKRELPAMLAGISRAGSKAGLNFLLFEPESEVFKEFYKEIPVSMKVEGSYHQISDFFFQIAHMNRIVNIENMTMKQKKKDAAKISMDCSAVTYMFVEPQEEKQGKKKNAKKKG